MWDEEEERQLSAARKKPAPKIVIRAGNDSFEGESGITTPSDLKDGKLANGALLARVNGPPQQINLLNCASVALFLVS